MIDVGCGTGTLAIGLKQRYPAARVIGIDADSEMLKARKAQVAVEFLVGLANSF